MDERTVCTAATVFAHYLGTPDTPSLVRPVCLFRLVICGSRVVAIGKWPIKADQNCDSAGCLPDVMVARRRRASGRLIGDGCLFPDGWGRWRSVTAVRWRMWRAGAGVGGELGLAPPGGGVPDRLRTPQRSGEVGFWGSAICTCGLLASSLFAEWPEPPDWELLAPGH